VSAASDISLASECGNRLPDTLDVLLRDWALHRRTLVSALKIDLLSLTRSRYLARGLTHQVNESGAALVRRLLRRDGADVFVKAGRASESGASGDSDAPVHTPVFSNDLMDLPQSTAGTVPHRRDTSEEPRRRRSACRQALRYLGRDRVYLAEVRCIRRLKPALAYPAIPCFCVVQFVVRKSHVQG